MPLRVGKAPFWVVSWCFCCSNSNDPYHKASSKLTGKEKYYAIAIVFASEAAENDTPSHHRLPGTLAKSAAIVSNPWYPRINQFAAHTKAARIAGDGFDESFCYVLEDIEQWRVV
ncbi:hypothetical protein EDD18DRAFT_1109354 [Armillaria luteobubalina]|uniref:Uncharacterized protein n=1 Tax=Armillaria luteobubalina TaxID=153913 RepID=A0AA39PYH5_9AGAR|nr:hypothetical protein EDD18DRAFT_1109354 [Armillaria luteobubalina]